MITAGRAVHLQADDMIDENLRRDILSNQFIYIVRTELQFDADEYRKLTSSLKRLAEAMTAQTQIDKDVALCLYETPQAIRNAFDLFSEPRVSVSLSTEAKELRDQLEEAWIEVDQLVVDCLKDVQG